MCVQRFSVYAIMTSFSFRMEIHAACFLLSVGVRCSVFSDNTSVETFVGIVGGENSAVILPGQVVWFLAQVFAAILIFRANGRPLFLPARVGF